MKVCIARRRKVKKFKTTPYLIEFMERAEFNLFPHLRDVKRLPSECKPLPDSRDFRFWYPELKFVELLRLRSEHVDFFIPSELLVGKKPHLLISLLLFLEKLKALQFSNLQREVILVSCLVFFILPLYKTRGWVFFQLGENDAGEGTRRSKKILVSLNICVCEIFYS